MQNAKCKIGIYRDVEKVTLLVKGGTPSPPTAELPLRKEPLLDELSIIAICLKLFGFIRLCDFTATVERLPHGRLLPQRELSTKLTEGVPRLSKVTNR